MRGGIPGGWPWSPARCYRNVDVSVVHVVINVHHGGMVDLDDGQTDDLVPGELQEPGKDGGVGSGVAG